MARRFFGIAVLVVCIASLITYCLSQIAGRSQATEPVLFPPAFALSTFLLAYGSLALHRAVRFVRVEKQQPFRLWLLSGLLSGTLFMGVQCYALWSMFPAERSVDEASRGVLAFILCLATLHAFHFLIAVLFVIVIVSRTWANRYDHEYYWGVRACACFWHFLGIVWIAILAVISIAQ